MMPPRMIRCSSVNWTCLVDRFTRSWIRSTWLADVQGYLAEAMFPFEYEEDFEAAITGEANPGAVRSYWDDEVNQDGTIERTAGRAAGTEDLVSWGQAVWVAMQTQAQNLDAAEALETEAVMKTSEEGSDEATSVSVATRQAEEAPAQDSKATIEQHGKALQALIIAKIGKQPDFSGVDAHDIKKVDADAAKAICEAAFHEQVLPLSVLPLKILPCRYSYS